MGGLLNQDPGDKKEDIKPVPLLKSLKSQLEEQLQGRFFI